MTTEAVSRSSLRRAALLVGIGASVYIAGDLFDVVGLVVNPYDLQDTTSRVAALEAEQTSWDVSHALAGAGHIIAALGLWVLGRLFAGVSTDRRGRLAATVAGWAGLATAVWAVNSYFAIVRSPAEVVASLENPTAELIASGAIFLLSSLVLFVTLGVTLLRLRHQRWLGWTLVVVGPLAALSIVGAGPSLPVALMLVSGIALTLRPYRSPNGASNTKAAKPQRVDPR